MTIATAPPHPLPVRTRRRWAGWTAVLLTSLAIAAYSVTPYLTSSLRALTDEGFGLASAYVDQPAAVRAAFYVHVVGGGLALLLGPWQFWAGLRRRLPRVHRWTGRTYLTAVGVGGVASLVMAPFNSVGFVGFFGFGTLGVLWLWTGWRGYRAIRSGDVRAHQAWMIRNFACTFAAVTLRAWTGLLLGIQIPFVDGGAGVEAAFANAYAAVPFLAWLPNLVVAELMVRRRGLPALRIVDPAMPAAGYARTEVVEK
ncbi:hypothetical protein ASE38_16480 [Cellulomonas sp. Root930]|nr:hypothetical protein ASE38_16480 [Cellulomonas sp. Root930]